MNGYWCIPSKEDAGFVACMEDVLDVYELPYNPARPVVCMDKKPYQLLGDAREPLSWIPPTQILRDMSKQLRKEIYENAFELSEIFPEKPSLEAGLDEEITCMRELLKVLGEGISGRGMTGLYGSDIKYQQAYFGKYIAAIRKSAWRQKNMIYLLPVANKGESDIQRNMERKAFGNVNNAISCHVHNLCEKIGRLLPEGCSVIRCGKAVIAGNGFKMCCKYIAAAWETEPSYFLDLI